MTLASAVDAVVRGGNCSGCGACTLLDEGLELAIDAGGFARPQMVGPSTARNTAESAFRESCPALRVRGGGTAPRHPTMGTVVAAWEAWAADAEVRRLGSSGGTLTALAEWITRTGRASRIIGATAAADARRTVSITITTRAEALAAAGSRYAPVTGSAIRDATRAGTAVIGQPCRVSALRALADLGERPDELLLSFFCAGTPSQRATDDLASNLGQPGAAPALRYRGDGWPGRFVVTRADGTVASLSYDESWGEHLGRAVQWRCKICPDGVGESADVAAADLWEADERGYPTFTEAAGTSALIARTERGHALVLAAIADGVLEARPLDIARLAAVQPLQVERRTTLVGRLIGARLAGRAVPRYTGFGLVALAVPRWRTAARVARATYRRARLAARSEQAS